MGRMMQPFGLAVTSPAMTAMYWQGFETAAKAWAPLSRTVSQIQLEAIGLAANRARACLEFPATLTQCRTPQDVLLAQSKFWQSAVSEMIETNQRLASGWQSRLADASKALATSMEVARDRLEFPDPTAPAPRTYASEPDDGRRTKDHHRPDDAERGKRRHAA